MSENIADAPASAQAGCCPLLGRERLAEGNEALGDRALQRGVVVIELCLHISSSHSQLSLDHRWLVVPQAHRAYPDWVRFLAPQVAKRPTLLR